MLKEILEGMNNSEQAVHDDKERRKNPVSTIKLKSISNKELDVLKVEDGLVQMTDGKLDYYFNNNSWWTHPVGKGASKRVDHYYGNRTGDGITFDDMKKVWKLQGKNLV